MRRQRTTTILVLAAAVLALFTHAPGVASGAPIAPDPGGDPSAAVPRVSAGKWLGLNDDAAAGLHGLSRVDYVELTRTIGGNVLRTNLDWRHAEPSRDRWDESWWSRWDSFYDEALDRGVTPLFVVGMAPGWAREQQYQWCSGFGACEYPPSAAMDGEWAEYVDEVARRFPRAIVEVWNEPNLRYYWESGADPERFAELLAIAYDAVEARSPSTFVLAGGLSNNQTTGNGHMALREFLDRAYAADPSIKGHMDAISFHPYPQSTQLGADTAYAKSFDDVRAVRDAHGDAATPLFLSEVGVSVAPPESLTEEQQAATMLAAYRRAMTTPDVIGIVFHRAAEPEDTTSNAWQLGAAWTLYGDSPPQPRPVYCRFVDEAGRFYPGCPNQQPLPTAIGAGPALETSSREASFEFESPNFGASYECSFDGSAYSSCWSPIGYSGLGESAHTFSVRTLGSAEVGRAEEEPVRYTFRVDVTPPAAPEIVGPAGWVNGRPLSASTLEFGVLTPEDGATLECALDGGEYEPCESPAIYTGLTEGQHAFEARARDAAGNASDASSLSLSVDTVAPQATLRLIGPPRRRAHRRRFAIGSSEPGATIECALDGAAFAACAASYRTTRLSRGRHVLRARAVDEAGNVDPTAAEARFRVRRRHR